MVVDNIVCADGDWGVGAVCERGLRPRAEWGGDESLSASHPTRPAHLRHLVRGLCGRSEREHVPAQGLHRSDGTGPHPTTHRRHPRLHSQHSRE